MNLRFWTWGRKKKVEKRAERVVFKDGNIAMLKQPTTPKPKIEPQPQVVSHRGSCSCRSSCHGSSCCDDNIDPMDVVAAAVLLSDVVNDVDEPSKSNIEGGGGASFTFEAPQQSESNESDSSPASNDDSYGGGSDCGSSDSCGGGSDD